MDDETFFRRKFIRETREQNREAMQRPFENRREAEPAPLDTVMAAYISEKPDIVSSPKAHANWMARQPGVDEPVPRQEVLPPARRVDIEELQRQTVEVLSRFALERRTYEDAMLKAVGVAISTERKQNRREIDQLRFMLAETHRTLKNLLHATDKLEESFRLSERSSSGKVIDLPSFVGKRDAARS